MNANNKALETHHHCIVVPASQVAQPIFVKQHLNSVPVHCRTILLDKYGIMMIMIMVMMGVIMMIMMPVMMKIRGCVLLRARDSNDGI